MLKRILGYALAPLVVLTAGAGGWRAAVVIGSPAVADGIDIIVFILLGLLAGWALLGLLSSLCHLPMAWRNWRAGIALPVLMKEMRQAMRRMKVPALMLAAAGLAVLAGGVVMASGWAFGLPGDQPVQSLALYLPEQLSDLGGQVLRAIFLLGALLALVLAPGLTAGAISGEREKSTLEMLLLTRMSPAQIVWGKLLSGLNVLGVILLCILPVAGVGFMLGGVAGWQLPVAIVMLAALAFCFGAIGLWCSARFRRTAVAVAVAYVLCLALFCFTPLATDIFIPMIYADDGSLLAVWLPMTLTVAAAIMLFILVLSALRGHFSGRMRRTGITICALVFLLGATGLLFGDRLAASLPLPATIVTNDWSEYIEYLDPVLAFGILLDPSGSFSYLLPLGSSAGMGIFASFDEDWPIILSNLAVFLLVAKLMLTLTRRRLDRLRQPDAPVKKAPA